MRKTGIYCLILLLMACSASLSAQNFSIEAQVDRDQVGFGESLSLVLTITQKLNSGSTQRLSVPAISKIPGFDIASTRSAQSTRFINGVGETQSQMLYELVPQQAGKITIPAFSFKDPEGNEHTTSPLEITVQPPEPEATAKPTTAGAPADTPKPGDGFFKWILYVGLALGMVVALPFIYYAFAGLSARSAVDAPGSATVQTNGSRTADKQAWSPTGTEDAMVTAVVAETPPLPGRQVNFTSAVDSLKRQFPDADRDFYRHYFDLFREAALARSGSLRANMTSDELFRQICVLAVGENVAHAARRLTNDIDMVMYANQVPARSFSSIDADAREIIRVIND